jgi:uncharacterized membrane protein YcjF (UPF0283 family)
MKERIHEQLENELKQASRTDTTITIIAIVVTFILFGVAFGFASTAVDYTYNFALDNSAMKLSVPATAAVFISLIAMVVIDMFVIFALRNNARRKIRLAESLAKLYQEEGASQYSPDDIAMGYKSRGNLFAIIIGTLAAFGIIIPLIVFINNLVEQL